MDNIDNTKDYCDNNGNWHRGVCVYTSSSCVSYFGSYYTEDSCKIALSECVGSCSSNCKKYAVVCKSSEDDCSDGLDNDCDGSKDCADTDDCVGKLGPNGYVCCQDSDDCKDAGETCDNNDPPYYHRYAECLNNECKKYDPCWDRDDCEDGYCCTREIPDYDPSPNPHQCKPKGTLLSAFLVIKNQVIRFSIGFILF